MKMSKKEIPCQQKNLIPCQISIPTKKIYIYSFHAKNHVQKILIPKSHGQKNSHTKNHIVHTCPKNPHDQSHNRKFSLSKITITKISMITQQKYSIAQNLIPIKFFRTHKIFPYSYLQNFAMLMK